MPRMKTSRAAAKRLKRTAGGRLKRNQSHRRHILTKKSTKRKRHLRPHGVVAAADSPGVGRMLPYAGV